MRDCLQVLRQAGEPGGLEPIRQMAQGSSRSHLSSVLRLIFMDEPSDLSEALLRYAEQPSGQEQVAAVPAWSPTAPIRRALTLMGSGKWIDAVGQLETCRSTSLADAHALLALCYAQLDGADAERDILDALSYAPDHPVGHLALAVLYDTKAGQQAEPSAKGRLRMRSFGQALAFALNTAAVSSVPEPIAALATKLLRRHGPSLGSLPSQALSAKRAPVEERWKAKAGQSKALQAMLKLTGLAPVKQSLISLWEMVGLDRQRGVDFKEQQYSAIFYGNPGTGEPACFHAD